MELFGKKPPAVQKPPLPALSRLAVDEEALYVVGSDGQGTTTLWRQAHGEQQATEVTHARDIRRVISHGNYLYFLSVDRIMRVLKRGGVPEELARHGWTLANMVSDGGFLYAAVADTRRTYEGGAPPVHPGVILRLPFSGGTLELLTEHHAGTPRLAVDERSLYLATDDGLAVVDKRHGTMRTLLTNPDSNERPTVVTNGGKFLYAALANGEMREIDKEHGAAKTRYRASILLDVAAAKGWVYVLRNRASLGPGKPPEPGAVIAISTTTPETRILGELANGASQLAIGVDTVFALEDPLWAKEKGLAQVKRFAACH